MIDAQVNDTVSERHGVSDLQERIRAFVTSNFYVADAPSLRNDASLLDSGVIDSTGVLEVIAFIERDFGIEVADEDIVPENLDSIERLTAYVQRRLG